MFLVKFLGVEVGINDFVYIYIKFIFSEMLTGQQACE